MFRSLAAVDYLCSGYHINTSVWGISVPVINFDSFSLVRSLSPNAIDWDSDSAVGDLKDSRGYSEVHLVEYDGNARGGDGRTTTACAARHIHGAQQAEVGAEATKNTHCTCCALRRYGVGDAEWLPQAWRWYGRCARRGEWYLLEAHEETIKERRRWETSSRALCTQEVVKVMLRSTAGAGVGRRRQYTTEESRGFRVVAQMARAAIMLIPPPPAAATLSLVGVAPYIPPSPPHTRHLQAKRICTRRARERRAHIRLLELPQLAHLRLPRARHHNRASAPPPTPLRDMWDMFPDDAEAGEHDAKCECADSGENTPGTRTPWARRAACICMLPFLPPPPPAFIPSCNGIRRRRTRAAEGRAGGVSWSRGLRRGPGVMRVRVLGDRRDGA
ncbi:hypothetical protein B0H19DRAFT_1068307 [Mycena capillaripes]|nr:hypothetical protein B0H19DRAFT_1068307 [Mycena capillaripes]